jgi:hypothetical protein
MPHTLPEKWEALRGSDPLREEPPSEEVAANSLAESRVAAIKDTQVIVLPRPI